MISARRRLRCQGDRIAGALRQLLQRAEERGEVARLRRVEQTQRLTKPLRVELGVLAGEGAPQTMQTPGGARVLGGGEMLGVAQSRFVLAQAQNSCARGGGASARRLRSAPAKGGFWRRTPSSKARLAPAAKKAAGLSSCAPRFDARPCGKRPIIQWALWRRGLGGRPPARARCGRRAGRGRREKRIRGTNRIGP